jgi:oxygen-independent coproporphyrinogen-3 oxidase
MRRSWLQIKRDGMWTYLPDLISRPVPRYTSYPTAMEFSSAVGGAEFASALDGVEADASLSLYIHIPFCEQICWYCGCNTGASGRKQRLADYVEALKAEITMAARHLQGRGRVTRIAFGGGSPNALAPIEFIRLLDHVTTLFGAQNPDISVEIDPRVFGAEWALVLGAAGVTRASFGVQTFAPHVQAAIGRVQPLREIEAAVSAVRAQGLTAVNFDLMYGLPGQSLADVDDTLNHALRLEPSRISFFGYAHLPDYLPRQRRIDAGALPDAELRFRQAQHGYQRLTEAGYQAIGFDHFARPDDPLAAAAREGRVNRNFQGFTEDDSDIVLGFGASAISQFPDRIVQNEKRTGFYRDRVRAGVWAAERGVMIGGQDRVRGRIIRDLLCRAAADVPADLLCAARAVLMPFEEQGLVAWSGDRLTISAAALPYARLIASEFDRMRGGIVRELTPV